MSDLLKDLDIRNHNNDIDYKKMLKDYTRAGRITEFKKLHLEAAVFGWSNFSMFYLMPFTLGSNVAKVVTDYFSENADRMPLFDNFSDSSSYCNSLSKFLFSSIEGLFFKSLKQNAKLIKLSSSQDILDRAALKTKVVMFSNEVFQSLMVNPTFQENFSPTLNHKEVLRGKIGMYQLTPFLTDQFLHPSERLLADGDAIIFPVSLPIDSSRTYSREESFYVDISAEYESGTEELSLEAIKKELRFSCKVNVGHGVEWLCKNEPEKMWYE